ncbi:MAG: hypothetical protein IKN74_07410 [Clostridia bacterium]|nr:hypothetical protein [Clostridia bacterium]
MKVILFSHESDIDGMGEVILSKLVFEDLEYILCKNVADLNRKIMEEYTKGKLYNADIIYITDLSLDEKEANIIFSDEKLKGKVFLFDHHKTAYESGLTNYPNVTVRVDDEKGISCATQLFYEYLIKENLIKQSKKLDEFVELVRREDTYEWKKYGDKKAHDLSILFNSLGYEMYIDRIYEKLKDEKTEEFDFTQEELNAIKRKKKETEEKVKNYIKDLKIIDIDGIKVGVCFIGYEFRNAVADYIIDTKVYDIDTVAMIALDNNQISFRCIHGGNYARIVAEKFGGGGHDKAAAVPITKDIKDKIIDLIFKK